jgi:hypothetical protein
MWLMTERNSRSRDPRSRSMLSFKVLLVVSGPGLSHRLRCNVASVKGRYDRGSAIDRTCAILPKLPVASGLGA